jgi:hypothetical protein
MAVYGTIDPMRRWLFFLMSILFGIAIGLFYGWTIQPITYMNTQLETLGIDYKTDYVLMVAEAYALEANPAAAQRRLAAIDETSPLETVHQAILFAESSGYNDGDLQRMRLLQAVLEGLAPPVERQGL